MTRDVLSELIELLNLERIKDNVFVGKSQDLGFRQLFGGQVLGQGLVAAYRTVENRRIHSLHAYFLRPGDPEKTIEYVVDRIRDGRSFSTRGLTAVQDGKTILTMTLSFQILEAGCDHQTSMPDVPGPEGLESELDAARRVSDMIPESVRDKFTRDRPIEIRPVDPLDYFNPGVHPPLKYNWFKTIRPIHDEWMCHECLLAYASDFGLLGASMLPHGVTFVRRGMKVASLDHALWFHRPARVDEWLLYAMDSPNASAARGFNRGSIFNQKGELIASVAQEGLIRKTS